MSKVNLTELGRERVKVARSDPFYFYHFSQCRMGVINELWWFFLLALDDGPGISNGLVTKRQM